MVQRFLAVLGSSWRFLASSALRSFVASWVLFGVSCSLWGAPWVLLWSSGMLSGRSSEALLSILVALGALRGSMGAPGGSLGHLLESWGAWGGPVERTKSSKTSGKKRKKVLLLFYDFCKHRCFFPETPNSSTIWGSLAARMSSWGASRWSREALSGSWGALGRSLLANELKW